MWVCSTPLVASVGVWNDVDGVWEFVASFRLMSCLGRGDTCGKSGSSTPEFCVLVKNRVRSLGFSS